MLWHRAQGLGGRVTFELLLIKGWCSQVSGSEQDLVTRAQRWNLPILPANVKAAKHSWPHPQMAKGKCQKIDELRDCALLTQRKVMAGELPHVFFQNYFSKILCTKKKKIKKEKRIRYILRGIKYLALFFAVFSHLYSQSPRLWNQTFVLQVVK